jgi:DNA repair exonuclease SbcCD ATPase subunit
VVEHYSKCGKTMHKCLQHMVSMQAGAVLSRWKAACQTFREDSRLCLLKDNAARSVHNTLVRLLRCVRTRALHRWMRAARAAARLLFLRERDEASTQLQLLHGRFMEQQEKELQQQQELRVQLDQHRQELEYLRKQLEQQRQESEQQRGHLGSQRSELERQQAQINQFPIVLKIQEELTAESNLQKQQLHGQLQEALQKLQKCQGKLQRGREREKQREQQLAWKYQELDREKDQLVLFHQSISFDESSLLQKTQLEEAIQQSMGELAHHQQQQLERIKTPAKHLRNGSRNLNNTR